MASPTQFNVMQEWPSPGRALLGKATSGSCAGFVVTVPWMLLKEILRVIAAPESRPGRGRLEGPMLIWIGPVTSSRTMFENDMFSKRDPGLPWNLMGQPYT